MTTTGRLYSTSAPNPGGRYLPGPSTRNFLLTLIAMVLLVSYAGAQLPMPASTQFDITGFIQEATLDSTCTADPHCGGTIKLNGHTIVVPKETIVILPANALTWQEIFSQAPAPYGLMTNPPTTGLAMADLPAPMTTYEAQVVGNRVITGGNDRYIAGLVYISQQGLNIGSGFINYINFTTGELRVGGQLGNPNDGARVRINDPVGRFGRVISPDVRFTVDPDNPTIASSTGFPMCLPRVDPATAVDPLCPQSQRPAAVAPAAGFASVVQMNDPVNLPGVPPDATIQAPLEVGDWITFSGTLVQDGLTPTAGPWPAGGTASTYISAYAISDNVAIYTWPNTNPAYVATEVTIIGTGGLTVVGAGEAVVRTRFEGMTTDVNQNAALQRIIHLYGIDFNPADGSTTDRDWGTIGVDPGPPNGAVKGRWRFRPPCLPFGSVPTKPEKDCVYNASGTFLPPTREMRAVIEGAWTPAGPQTTYANGIVAGQYHAPILEYIFPENVPGSPIVENNFNTMPFLAQGGYTSTAGTLVGQLNPWPSDVTPAPYCAPPTTASAGGPYTVGSGGTVGLSGTSDGTGPFMYLWTANAGAFDNATVTSPNFTAPTTAIGTTVNLAFTATNSCGSATANTTVTVNAAMAPVMYPIAPQSVTSGNSGSFAVSASDPNNPPSVPLTWMVSQTGPVALMNLTITSTGASSANVTFTAPSGVMTATDVTVSVTTTNAAGVASAPVATTVTINPSMACDAPVANAGGPYTVGSGGSITLAGSATGTAPITFAWASPAQGSINSLSSPTATYTAPLVLTQTMVNLSLTATNSCGNSTATSTVTINAALAPTVNPIANISVFSGAAGSFAVSGSDPNVPALLPLTFAATQAGAPALANLTVTQGPNPPGTGATVSFTAPTLPVGQVTPAVITLSVTATNPAAKTSAPATMTVTVKPLPDIVAVTAAEYRIGKQRLSLTATSSVVSTNVVLKLQPYLTTTGTIYNPDPAAGGLGNTFTNTGGGIYTIDLVGVPAPACGNAAGYQTPCPSAPLDVKSNLNGDSGPVALTRIRQ